MKNEIEDTDEKKEDLMFSEKSIITGEKNDNSIPDLNNEEKLKAVDQLLENSRNMWGKKIIDLVQEIKDIDKLKDAQVTMLSYRQMLVDHLAKFNIRLRKIETTLEREYKRRYLTYFNNDIKLSDKEKAMATNADLFFHRRQIALLEVQTDYYRECIKTLDQMAWAIKNRINIVSV